MKKKIAFAVSALALLALASCQSPFEEQKIEEDKFNLTIATYSEEGEETVLKELASSYQKTHPEINIIVKTFGGELFRNYMTKYASNQDKLPDMIWMPDDQFAAFADGGYFLDLRSFYEASPETSYSNYYSSMLNAASYIGEYKPLSEDTDPKYGIYYAPRDYDKIGIVYNTKLFEEYDIAVPSMENWDMNAFYALCKSISAKLGRGSNRVITLNSWWEPVYTTLFKELGGDGLVTAEGKCNLGSDANRAVESSLYDNLFADEKIMQSQDNDFTRGLTFMTVVARPRVAGFKTKMAGLREDGKSPIDFLPMPCKSIAAGCSGYGIVKKHAEEVREVKGEKRTVKDLAWDFIKYIITEDGQEAAGKTGLSVPVLKSLAKTGEWRKAIDASLNHDAWLAGEELRLTTYNIYKPNARAPLRDLMTAFMSNLEKQAEGKPEKREKLISDYTNEFNKKAEGNLL